MANKTIIGGIEYLSKNMDYQVPYIIFYIIIAINGILGRFAALLKNSQVKFLFYQGNLLILLSIITIKEMHTTANMLIFNLATIDFFISSFVDPFTIAGKKKETIFF
jgi:hypothetical protein